MQLGAFSISLDVKDIKVSATFYKQLGFLPIGGNIDDKWLILKNEDAVIGLFEGMFQGHILTFNPGWNQAGEHLEQFLDVRKIKEHLDIYGISATAHIDTPTGPGYITLKDPDGNAILIDQHR
ncbi:MAG TPA: VOC family protein [Bacilli bacterium]|nr:VOC family protein [Bacilli bacterium]